MFSIDHRLKIKELIERAESSGIQLYLSGKELKWKGAHDIGEDLLRDLRAYRDEVIKGLQRRRRPRGVGSLDKQGRLIVKDGLWPSSKDIVDVLLEAGASDTEIEKHITEHHHPKMWKKYRKARHGDE